MRRDRRLRRSQDFARVRAEAPRGWAHPLLALYAAPRPADADDDGTTRLGITVGKRVARQAVHRNRVRRRIREAVRLLYPHLSRGTDLVIVARPPARDASWPEVQAAVETVLRRARLLHPFPQA